MDSAFHGRPPSRRCALGDGTNRANERPPSQQRDVKQDSRCMSTSQPQRTRKKVPYVPNGSPAIHHEPSSPENKHLSAVQAQEQPPHNSRRDSEISNASTNASTSNRRRKTHIGPWQLGRTIGRGGCSRVRLVRHSGTGQYGAAKIISKSTAEKVRALSLANLIQSAENDPALYPNGKAIPFGLEREICIMKLLNHPNIVRLYDIWENRDEIYIIMEFVEGGELFSYIHEQGGLIEIHAVHIFRQITAALIYCHRIGIHHRDLKPENILLDRRTMTVKLVDFGMAALQPAGKKLTTPCGSPHYAAPEVIRTTSYDGAKADVWSCGVVLFVLLTGRPPFNYSGDGRHLRNLFRDIAAAKYVMPDTISTEAQDLIRSILVPDPKRRISLEGIWNHPFLQKYHQELNFLGENAQLDQWTGPEPVISDWTTLDKHTVDRDILRYLRTLWHSEKEETLIQKLVSQEPNHEKFFYAALRKYHIDQLENYQPSSQYAVTHSNSDYHHITRCAPTGLGITERLSNSAKGSQSAYSILNNEHLYSKNSLHEPPASEASYDPYRASRQPVIPTPKGTPPSQHVRVYRRSSGRSDNARPTTALGHRTGSSLRVRAMRNNSKRSSAVSHGSSNRSNSSQRMNSVQRRSMSRSSLTSSQWASSPPVIIRPRAARKRGVSFSHLHNRRSSAATTSSWQTDVGSCAEYISYKPQNSIGSYDSAMRTSAVLSNIKSRAHASTETPRLKLKKRDSTTKFIQGEARKFSMELSKAMEEAFNRSSVGSSIQPGTEISRHASQYDSPLTSFSNTHNSGRSTLFTTPTAQVISRERPLPAIPAETPNTFVQRKLAETRAEIARRLKEEGTDEHYNDILDNLDRLMVPVTNSNKRLVSAPAKSPDHGPLHVIPEEGKTDNGDGLGNPLPRHRVFTDPTRPQDHRVAPKRQQTIRVVDGSPTRIAPLNICKRSAASLNLTKPVENITVTPWLALNGDCAIRPNQDPQNDLVAARTHNDPPALEKQNHVIKKKRSWFRRDTDEKKKGRHDEKENQVKKKQSNGLLKIAEAWHGNDDQTKNDPANTSELRLIPEKSDKNSGSEFPTCNSNPGPSKDGSTTLKGLLALFGRKSREEVGKNAMKRADMNFSSSSIQSSFDLGPDSSKDGARTGLPEMQMNWISRFLHIKPATAILCLQVGRGKVRQDFVHLLRGWQRFGVQDVTLDRQSNSISARIDKNNHLKIKPVSFVIELFVVLEHGRRANLSIARSTQTRGAASSFRKVFDIIEDICRARSMLVEDEQKKASMLGILD